jgi:hypothetical protein
MKNASSYRGQGLSYPELSPQIYVHFALLRLHISGRFTQQK